jgi:hypothetical protein
MKVPTQKKIPLLSVGSIMLQEKPNGEMAVTMKLSEGVNSDPQLILRIKAAMAGMCYVYEKDTDNIDNIGLAFLEGLEKGMEIMGMEDDDDEPARPAKPQPEAKQKMGFHS